MHVTPTFSNQNADKNAPYYNGIGNANGREIKPNYTLNLSNLFKYGSISVGVLYVSSQIAPVNARLSAAPWLSEVIKEMKNIGEIAFAELYNAVYEKCIADHNYWTLNFAKCVFKTLNQRIPMIG